MRGISHKATLWAPHRRVPPSLLHLPFFLVPSPFFLLPPLLPIFFDQPQDFPVFFCLLQFPLLPFVFFQLRLLRLCCLRHARHFFHVANVINSCPYLLNYRLIFLRHWKLQEMNFDARTNEFQSHSTTRKRAFKSIDSEPAVNHFVIGDLYVVKHPRKKQTSNT